MPTFCPTPAQRDALRVKEWSYSSLDTFKKCPYSFYRKYCLKDYRESPNTFFGKAVHDYAEAYAHNVEPDKEELLVKNKVQKSLYPDFDYCVDNIKEVINRDVKPYRRFIEKKYYMKLGGFNFVFILDLVIFRTGTIYLYDWKSSETTRYAKNHREQMGFYHYPLKNFHPGKEIVTHLIFPRCNKTVLLETDPFKEENAIKNVNIILACNDFQPKTHKFCGWCDFKQDVCPIFNP